MPNCKAEFSRLSHYLSVEFWVSSMLDPEPFNAPHEDTFYWLPPYCGPNAGYFHGQTWGCTIDKKSQPVY
jgi:hypothetical protein